MKYTVEVTEENYIISVFMLKSCNLECVIDRENNEVLIYAKNTSDCTLIDPLVIEFLYKNWKMILESKGVK